MSARACTSQEIARLPAYFGAQGNTRDRLFLVLEAASGLRAQEMLGITLGDLWDSPTADVVRELYVQRAPPRGRSALTKSILTVLGG